MDHSVLPDKQVDAFWQDGFYSPVAAFTPAEADAMRGNLEAFERTLPPGAVAPMYRRRLHAMLPWMREVVGDPRVLDVIESLIGPDILVFTSTFFIKEARTPTVTAWHQDALYLGITDEHVSAWVAFSDASEAAGCLRFVRGSQKEGLLRHTNQVVGNSLNVVGQAIERNFDPDTIVAAPLRRGQLSLHHTKVIHSSAPNETDDRRIGVGISYIPTRAKHRGTMRLPAMLVRGKDRYGYYDLEPDPRDSTPEEARQAHAAAFAQYRQGYDEQMRIVADAP
jgi:non-haem Fe2+, alpha-ketoglutarate-dependent halogenase